MGGIPKPLTKSQRSTFDAYTARKNGEGKPLTDKQLAVWGDLFTKDNTKCILNDSAKKTLDQWAKEEIYKRRRTLSTLQMDKGIEGEESAITLYSKVSNTLLLKNKFRKENDYFTGETDIKILDRVDDIKTSWVYDSFPLSESSISNKNYEWQLDAYMDLWEVKNSRLVYCLINTPHRLIEGHLRKLDWNLNIMDMDGNIHPHQIPLVVEEVSQHIFTNKGLEEFCKQSATVRIEWFADFIEIPEELRVKVFEHPYCPIRNLQLKEMIELARDYMNGLLEDMGGELLKLSS